MHMDELEHVATATEPLLTCSLCRSLLQEAVLLKCLHNCCQQCFRTAAEADGGHERIACGLCGAMTQVGSEQPNGFIDSRVKWFKMIAESRTCMKCRENGECDKPAMVWCPACRHSLCGDCICAHRQYNRQHVTQSLEELKSLDEVCSEPPVATCKIHGKPLDIVCLNCRKAMCTSCWASCKEKKHEVHIVSEESFDHYVGSLTSAILSMESELLRKSAVLERPRIVLQDTKAARDRHLEELNKRKRRVMDAVEEAYEKMALYTKDAYDDIESEGLAAAEVAERIASDLSDAQGYIRRLVDSNVKCEMFKQQKMLRERLSVLSAELDNLSDRVAIMSREVSIEASLPENLRDVIRAWIGTPRTYAASPPQQQQSFSFGAASDSFKLPVHCWDVALTKDGHSLLLAAAEHGLIELSSSCGHELSRWRSPKLSSSQDDLVLAVEALPDGRAAVSLHFAQLVVLLRRSKKDGSSTTGATTAAAAAAGDSAWTEDRRIDVLPWPLWSLSAHGDVLAASEYRWNEQTNRWWFGPRLMLLSLSSGRLLSAELQREYDIFSLAVAADMVVTGSFGKVKLDCGRRAARVLDAHSLTEDTRLWRHELVPNISRNSDNKQQDKEEEEERLYGVCLDSSGGCLYAAVLRTNLNSGRVSALSLADGSELRRVALSFTSAAAAALPQLPLLPWRLSLCDEGAASAAAAEQQQQQQQQLNSGRRVLLLAALCRDATTKECRTLTLHRSTSDMLQ